MSTLTAPSLADCIARCRLVQESWQAQPVSARLRPVANLRRLLVTERDSLCTAVAEDVGKTVEETITGDILPVADACAFLQSQAARILRPRRMPTSQRPFWLWGQADTVYRRPHGVVGIIGTWNYPILLNGIVIVQALTAGNAVVWKPSEVAPATARAFFRLLQSAGYPDGLIHMMEPTREGGPELANADVDHVAFTGSSAVGRVLAETLGRRLVSSTLELSGCDAMFVLPDADVDLAARAAWFGATVNRGQTCLAVRRAIVHASLYPAFVAALRSLAAGAAPMQMALPSQKHQAQRLIDEAVTAGARLLVPAVATEGNVCHAAVVVDAKPDMSICREASFAPVLAVLPFGTVDEAIEMDRQCPYGLGASIFTRDVRQAERLASSLRTGMVTVNDVIVPTVHPATPFGGWGESGWGVTQGVEGLLGMTVPQVVSASTGKFRPHYDLANGSGGSQREMVEALLEAGHAPGFLRRLAALVRLVRLGRRGKPS